MKFNRKEYKTRVEAQSRRLIERILHNGVDLETYFLVEALARSTGNFDLCQKCVSAKDYLMILGPPPPIKKHWIELIKPVKR